MGDPLILCSHLPGEGHLHSERFEVRPVLCRDEWDYWRGLNAEWDSDRVLINCEHDIDWSDDHLSELVACPHPLCSWAYCAHWASSGLPFDIIAAGAGARDAENHPPPDAYYLQGGEEWAAWSAIGLVKIAPDARTGPLRREPWNFLELAVEDAVKGPWHMHGNGAFPGDHSGHVAHHHW